MAPPFRFDQLPRLRPLGDPRIWRLGDSKRLDIPDLSVPSASYSVRAPICCLAFPRGVSLKVSSGSYETTYLARNKTSKLHWVRKLRVSNRGLAVAKSRLILECRPVDPSLGPRMGLPSSV